jgi:hypothetical protein
MLKQYIYGENLKELWKDIKKPTGRKCSKTDL